MLNKKRPGGGARGGPCEKSGQVVIWYPRSVCAKFGINRGNGSAVHSKAKSVTDRQRDKQTDRRTATKRQRQRDVHFDLHGAIR